MNWLKRLAPARAYVAVSLRDGLAAVRVEPAAAAGGRLRVTMAAQHSDAQIGARQLRAKGLLRGAHQVLVLPGSLRTFHSLPRPNVPDAELLEAVRWQVAASLDHPPDEALVQVLTLPELSDNPQQQLLAVVAHGPSVREHLAPLHASGWAPEIVDIEETAQRNLMLLAAQQDTAGACVGFAGHDALITLVAGGELCLTRSVGIDPDDPAAAIERLGLQLQRALDGFERQTTRFAMRSVLLLPGPLADRLAAALAVQVTQRLSRLSLADLFDVEREAAAVLDDPTLFANLLGAVAGRLQTAPASAPAKADSSAASLLDSVSDGLQDTVKDTLGDRGKVEPTLDGADSQPGLLYDPDTLAALQADQQRSAV